MDFESSIRDIAERVVRDYAENHLELEVDYEEQVLRPLSDELEKVSCGIECGWGDAFRKAIDSILEARGIVPRSTGEFAIPQATVGSENLRSLQVALRNREEQLSALRSAVQQLWGYAPNGEDEAPELQGPPESRREALNRAWNVAREATYLLAIMRGVIRHGDDPERIRGLASSWRSAVERVQPQWRDRFDTFKAQ